MAEKRGKSKNKKKSKPIVSNLDKLTDKLFGFDKASASAEENKTLLTNNSMRRKDIRSMPRRLPNIELLIGLDYTRPHDEYCLGNIERLCQNVNRHIWLLS